MKILYIADSSSWHNAKWTEFFADSDEYSVWLFSDYKKNYKKVKFRENIKIIQISPVIETKSRHFNKFISIPYYVFKLRKIIKKENFDVLHSVALYYGLLSILVSRNIPVVYTLQGSEILVNARSNSIYKWIANLVLTRANVVTGDSKKIISESFKYGNSIGKSHLIQNGVDLRLFNFSLHNERSSVFRVFSPRGLIPLYNIDSILRAFASLVNDYRIDAELVLAFGFGDEYLESLKELSVELNVSDKVCFVGFLSHNEMVSIYQSCDVVVSIPSSDSSPKSVYESMACGTPVIASNLDWLVDNFTDGENIYSVDLSAGIISDVARKLYEIASCYSDTIPLVVNARKIIEDGFSFEVNMSRMSKILKDSVHA